MSFTMLDLPRPETIRKYTVSVQAPLVLMKYRPRPKKPKTERQLAEMKQRAMNYQRARRERNIAAGLRANGETRHPKRLNHPELKGLSRKEYTRAIMRKRRAATVEAVPCQ